MAQQNLVAFITFTVSLFGIVINFLVLFSIGKTVSMKNSFGIITKNLAVCNIVMCGLGLFFLFPMQLAPSSVLVDNSHFVGVVSEYFYENSNFSHFLVSLNRFCAMYLPLYYAPIFCVTKTKFYLTFLWAVSIIGCTAIYEVANCHLEYDADFWNLQFIKISELCEEITWYSDFLINAVLTLITLSLDLLAAYKGRKLSRALLGAAGLEVSEVQRKREWNFVKQTCCQGLGNCFAVLSYYIFAPFLHDDWIVLKFFITSLWMFMHAFDGMIIFASNCELRSVFFKKQRNSSMIKVTYSSRVL
ncbi:G-protein coupled receptors family 1 profile domain-containing protein [Caenorhabditis elegans]|uniref:G-protein coupled receptors family 1 profile domain-containing protein n=1 Tax=Caenorhabditis elegans TaxID=6239 RepID=O76442_CAEEL|nr:G-protein coupled receptors family 1 profile domain-containing protein [Caenorhabditis elegans]CCD65473.2 G-protein coupled receptors family 1 profile domain-containing protein [Caenorhabditis elegans]|eukprot:NP_001023670.2 Serpentine Receptor, class X [Caenorhabditis elegans]